MAVNRLRVQSSIQLEIDELFDMLRGGSLNLDRQPDEKVLQPIQIVSSCMTCVVSSLQIPSVMQYCVGKVHQILLPR